MYLTSDRDITLRQLAMHYAYRLSREMRIAVHLNPSSLIGILESSENIGSI